MLDLLLVEDDTALSDVLGMHLAAEGWALRTAHDGEQALDICAERLPDLLVLDVMLPKRSGLEVCRELRARYHPSPGVLMLTARDTELDVILGFDVGADDYVVKPCRPRELAARVRAVARRLGPPRPSAAPEPSLAPANGEPTVAGGLRIDHGARRVSVAARGVKLTPTEFELLAFLAREPERVFSRMELLEQVFDSAHEGYARNVDCHVTRLRRKLEAAGLEPAPIRTVHGIGYCFERV